MHGKSAYPICIPWVGVLLAAFLLGAPIAPAIAETYVSSNIGVDTTWTLADSPVILTNDIVVNTGVKLTIAAGVNVQVQAGRSLTVRGTLITQGTQTQGIVFEPYTGVPRNPGAWKGIRFEDSSTGNDLKYTSFLYAGGGGFQGAVVFLNLTPANLKFDHCEIRYSGSAGLYMAGSSGAADYVAGWVRNCNGDAIYLGSNSTPCDLNGNTITDNTGRAYAIGSNKYMAAGYVSNNGGFNGAELLGSINATTSGTYGVPIRCAGSLTVASGATVTLAPGVTAQLGDKQRLSVASGGRLVAEGTKDFPITFTSWTGRWGGIDFANNSSGSLKHCVLDQGGGGRNYVLWFDRPTDLTVDQCEVRDASLNNVNYYPTGIYGNSSGNVTLTNNNIHDNAGHGLYLSGTWPVNPTTGTCDQLKNNTIKNNGKHAFALSANIYPDPGTAEVSGNGDGNGILFDCLEGAVTVSGTYQYDLVIGNRTGSGGYRVMDIKAGATVTLPPGRRVTIWDTYRVSVSGKLVAEGNAQQGIVFTAQQPSVGAWGYLYFGNNSEGILKYCDVDSGGGAGSGMIWLDSPKSLLIENCTLLYSGAPCLGGTISTAANRPSVSVTVRQTLIGSSNAEGINVTVLDNAVFLLEDCIIRTNKKHGVYLRGNSNSVVVRKCTVAGNTGDAFNLDPNVYPEASSVSGNGFDGITVDGGSYGGEVSRSGTYAFPLRLLYGLQINAGTVLTIAPGMRVALGAGRAIRVAGELFAEGTSSSPLLFTADTASPTRGYWENVLVQSGGKLRMKHATLEYGRDGTVYVNSGGSAALDSCVVRESSSSGVRVFGSLVMVGSEVHHNAGPGVEINSAGNSITGGAIHDNGGPGVRINSGSGNTVSRCAIYNNTGLGIDIDPLGVNTNDANDADTGPNDRQNYPVLLTAFSTSGGTLVQGGIDTQSGEVILEFYANDALHSSGYGPGQTYLGSTTVTVGSVANFTVLLPPVPTGKFITATATRAGNTSEFSAGLVVLPGFSFSQAAYTVSEDAGTALITVQLSAPLGTPASVDFTTSDGTATAGSDYTATSGTLTFAPGETTKTFGVPITNDTRDEEDETIRLALTNPAGAGLGTPSQATLTIVDDDNPPSVAFSSSQFVALEEVIQGSALSPSVAVITVRLSAASGRLVSVKCATSDGTAVAGRDYSATSETLIFQPGEIERTMAVPITMDDLDEDDETVNLALSDPVNATLGTPATAILTITDNDNPPSVAFRSDTFTANEGSGNASIAVKLSTTSGRTVTVKYATSDNTATAGSDYTATTGTLTFAPGETEKTFSVPITEDTLDEEDETVALALSDPVNATLGTPASATLIIVDNDDPPSVAFKSATYAVDENGGSAPIAVKLSAPSGKTVTVNYATSDGTATAGSDYTAASGTLTFAPGEIEKTFSVPITDDNVDESDETVNLALSSPVNAILGTPETATLTIRDNEGAPTVYFVSDTYQVSEGGGVAAIGVKLSAPSASPVTVEYATHDGTATAGSDYTATSGTLTFAPGETSKTFDVPILQDHLDEPDETVLLALANPQNADPGVPMAAILTITDDDGPPAVAFALATYAVNEGAGAADITVILSSASTFPVTVEYATSNGTATDGSDYTATSGTLNFAPGETSKTFRVPVIDDALDEPDESVNLTLHNPVNAVLGALSNATLVIVNNNGMPSVSFAAAAYWVREDEGFAQIGVVLSAPSGRTVTVAYATSDGTATAGSDYTTTTGILTFAPGETSKDFAVPILDDTLVEADETVLLALTNATNANLREPKNATLTIQDVEPDRLAVTGVNPARAENFGVVHLQVQGRRLMPGLQVWLAQQGEANVPGTDVALSADAPGTFSARFDITGIKPGAWDVVVRNSDGQEAALTGGFTVEKTQPIIAKTNPDRLENLGSAEKWVPFQLSGERFLPGSTLTLKYPTTGRTLQAKDVRVSEGGTRVDALVPIQAEQAGMWHVRVHHPHAHEALTLVRISQARLHVTQTGMTRWQRRGRWETSFIKVTNVGDVPCRGAFAFLKISEGGQYRLWAPDEKGVLSVLQEGISDGRQIPFWVSYLEPGQSITYPLQTFVPAQDATGSSVWKVDFLVARHANDPDLDPSTPRVQRIAPLVFYAVGVTVVPAVLCYLGYRAVNNAGKITTRHALEVEFAKHGIQITNDQWDEIHDALRNELGGVLDNPATIPLGVGNQLVNVVTTKMLGFGVSIPAALGRITTMLMIGEMVNQMRMGQLIEEERVLRQILHQLEEESESETERRVVNSIDPNTKVVSVGDDAFVRPETPLGYSIFFENKPDATAAAQEVTITDQISPNLDYSTFTFGEVAFGNRVILPPENPADPTKLNVEVDLRPSQNMVVRIQGAFDPSTGIATWTFRGIDPDTGDLAWPGFLPPNVTAPEGEGFVCFRIQPRTNLASGTQIRNGARIVFDVNPPLDTREVVTTVDSLAPQSRVKELAAEQSSTSFSVSWEGRDDASGVARYNVYAAEDEGEFLPWLVGTEATSAPFVGRFGHRYRFYAVAVDKVGNREAEKTTAEAETRVRNVPPIPAGLRLVSLPFIPETTDPRAVFAFEGDKWARWHPERGEYVFYGNDPQGLTRFDPAEAVPGRGYWAFFANPVTPQGEGRTAPLNDLFAIPLKKGWNMIGVPFLAPVAWDLSQIRVQDSTGRIGPLAQMMNVVEGLAWGWNDEAKRYFLVGDSTLIPGAVDHLETWQGYWVLAYQDATLFLPSPARWTTGGARLRRRNADRGTWSACLQVKAGGSAAEVTFGQTTGRTMAIPQPPVPPSGSVGVQASLRRGGLRLAMDVTAVSSRQEWELLVEPAPEGQAGEVVVSWPNLSQVPKDVRLTLVDEATGERRSLRTTSCYTFQSDGTPRVLRLLAEPRTGPAVMITGLGVTTSGRSGASRFVRFSLSTAASVDLEVLSPSGQTVAQVARRRTSEAGLNQVPWSGPVAPGIYLVRVTATTEEGAAVQAVCPVVLTR